MNDENNQEPTSLGNGWRIKERKKVFRQEEPRQKTESAEVGMKPTPDEAPPAQPSWLIKEEEKTSRSGKRNWIKAFASRRVILMQIALAALIAASYFLWSGSGGEDVAAGPQAVPGQGDESGNGIAQTVDLETLSLDDLTANRQAANETRASRTTPSELIIHASATDTIERSGTLDVELKLSAPSERPVKINYETLPQTAAVGKDYVRSSGSVTIMPGDQSATFSIDVVDDDIVEPDETFALLLLSESSLAKPRPQLLQGKIIDDDEPGKDLGVDRTIGMGGPLEEQALDQILAHIEPRKEVEVAAILPSPRPQPRQETSLHYRIQIGALPDRNGAERLWIQSQKRYGKLIAGIDSHVESAKTTYGEIYRLQIGSFETKEEANDLCAQLAERGASCFVVVR